LIIGVGDYCWPFEISETGSDCEILIDII
jgi:hypothetical protein